MKVTVDIDCTPEEARTFFGLPDVKPMQKAMMNLCEAMAKKRYHTELTLPVRPSAMPSNTAWRDNAMMTSIPLMAASKELLTSLPVTSPPWQDLCPALASFSRAMLQLLPLIMALVSSLPLPEY